MNPVCAFCNRMFADTTAMFLPCPCGATGVWMNRAGWVFVRREANKRDRVRR